jgi:RimJ/RimL family protein N-acetyltransferase
MLTYCFEILKANRVQLKTRTTNLRSQAAIRKIGAKEEGILRKDRIMQDGTVKDTILFSVIDEEWEGVKERLEQELENRFRA